MRYRNLDDVAATADRADLLAVFVAEARTAEATVDVVPRSGSDAALDAVVAEVIAAHGISTAVISNEPEVAEVAALFQRHGVEVQDYSRERAAAADLAITSATLAIAATGSVVVDSDRAGSRAVSLLPRVHLCVVSAEMIVATPAEVLRVDGGHGSGSCRVIITGPSRTGDIEQRLTLGAHGPIAMHIIVTDA